ncbi:phosphoribosylaminoimidazolesuccinocarboxamide synthase [Acidipila sp. EB88]|uniref:phosphoribosylaminoimidazolesuccinocarboxamide synthase n=1 Tax=Acidipila sp. EB88 TaxID=2305226 RepID=UPI000F5F1118|nr:phosphoribosylaminoimidazolesuccinocarboxamide synthase [Acidipila sp. EB88]RRA47206.1 phosphoribosylaminoimidazolesuccinocarboxamide synthase [Acidipila sp. EB88]
MQDILPTSLAGIPKIASGKVRDLYAVGDDLLLVASDRISAFDHVLGSEIPGKGKVLTQLSLFWFEFLEHTVPNHLIQSEVDVFPTELLPFREELRDRSMLVKRANMFPVECVVRGYLSGSGWKDYQQTGALCGIALPAGLREGDALPEPLFTPASKSQQGEHDENISFADICERIGRREAETLRDLSLTIYSQAARHADQCGLILADTKFEFGTVGDVILLADEVLTPDSSRFWPRDGYTPGGAQQSFDKQFVRNYLEDVAWNKQAPAPVLPWEIIERTQEKYLEAYRVLTGKALSL